MRKVLECLLLALMAATASGASRTAPASSSTPGSRDAASKPLLDRAETLFAPLADVVQKARSVPVLSGTEVEVEGVRKRLVALASLRAAARPFMAGKDLVERLRAHRTVGEEHFDFAEALLSGSGPPGLRADAREAFHEQTERVAYSAFSTASAHLRSCADLGEASVEGGAIGKSCRGRLHRIPSRLGGGPSPRLPDEAAQTEAVAKVRMHELSSCVDALLRADPQSANATVTARLSIDAQGRVQDVVLPADEPARGAFYDCARNAMTLWVFPGLSDVEIELPIRVAEGG